MTSKLGSSKLCSLRNGIDLLNTPGNWISRKYSSFRRDPKSVLYLKWIDFWQSFFLWPSTIGNYLNAWAWGIDLGRGCKFYGKTYFQRVPLSRIQIGSQCVFRSSFSSNLIGLNHGCAISTHNERATIKIGNRCGLSGTIISANESISLGEFVYCGANTVIMDFDSHAIDPYDRLLGRNVRSAPVEIENNVWLGLNCLVLKGVHIGENTVVGANSVVTKNLPSNVIAVGNPAKVIRAL